MITESLLSDFRQKSIEGTITLLELIEETVDLESAEQQEYIIRAQFDEGRYCTPSVLTRFIYILLFHLRVG